MPQLDANSNRPRAAAKKIRRKKQQHPRGQQGPISKTSAAQPGPLSDREMEIINKRKRKPAYRKAVRAARVHGPETRRGTGPGEDKSVTPAQQRAIDKGVRAARVRVLRRSSRGAGTRALKAELEGRGELVKVSGALGKRVAPGLAVTTRTLEGKPPIKVGGLDLRTPSSRGSTELLKRAGKDFVNLPAQALPSLYQPAAGLIEAAQGRPERLRKLARTFDETDPVYNAALAAINAAGGNKDEAHRRLKAAVDAASEHPGMTFAEAFGVAKGVSHGAGAVGRSGALGSTVRRAVATTGREPRTLPRADLVEHREYSRDPVVKAGQVVADKRRARRHPETANEVSTREVHRRVDEAVAVADELARHKHTGADLESLAGDVTDRIVREFGVKDVDALPQPAIDRLLAHEDSRQKGSPVLKIVNRQFRETVLATSPKWLAGNIIEGVGRAVLNRAGPRSYVTGRRVLKRLEEITPDQAQEAMARMVGGGHLASVRRQRIEVGPDYFKGSDVAPIADALGKIWKTPGPKQAAGLWHGWTELVFRQVNGRIETGLQTAQLGRELRRSELMDSSMIKLGDKAIEQAAQGLKATEQQVRFGRKVDQAYGRYSKLSPAERHWIATYTPFVRWYLNSIDFVFRTLPRDHPVVLATIAAAEQATAEWRKDHKLDKFVDDALPDWLQGSIPTGDGESHQRISQFTPFGAFSDTTGTAAGQLTPLFSSVAAALSGQTWSGDPLRVDAGNGKLRSANEVERAVAAAHEFLKATVPGASVIERVSAGGPRVLDPFRDVKPKTKTGSIPKIRRPRKEFDSKPSGFFDTPAEREGSSFFGG